MHEGGFIELKLRRKSLRHSLVVRVGVFCGGGMYFGWREDPNEKYFVVFEKSWSGCKLFGNSKKFYRDFDDSLYNVL